MRVAVILMFWMFISNPLSAWEGIFQAAHPAAIEQAIDSVPSDSLIIFDVWSTLIDPVDAVLHVEHRPWRRQWFVDNQICIDAAKWRRLMSFIDRDVQVALVNPALAGILEKAKAKGKTILLSKFWCGQTEQGISFEEQRLASLKNLGIDLAEPFPLAAGWQEATCQATYGQGLIQTEARLKGPVLQAFIKHIGWQPKAIVFTDDQREQCESIVEAAKEMGIPAVCIHYTEAIDRIPSLDTHVAGIQLRTLVQEERWISEEEVRLQLFLGVD